MLTAKKIEEAFLVAQDHGIHENEIQRKYALRVGDIIRCALKSDDLAGQGFVEGETGTGKTLGYLIPMLLQVAESGQRAIVSTYTRALQRQIMAPGGDMERALAVVEKMTGKRLSVARRMGRNNFIDPMRAREIHSDMLEDLAKAEMAASPAWMAFLKWLDTTQTGELQEFLDDDEMLGLPPGITPEDVCVGQRARGEESLRHYKDHVEAAKVADVVVTNHALLVRAGMIRNGMSLFHDLGSGRGIDVLVVDEADRLVSVAEDATTDQLSLLEFQRRAEGWSEKREDNLGVALVKAVKELRSAIEAVYPEYAIKGKESALMWSELGAGFKKAVAACLGALARVATQVLAVLGEQGDDTTEDGLLESELRLSLGIANGLFADDESSMIALRWSPTLKYPSIRKFRLKPARVLASMWKVFKTGQGELDLEGEACGAARLHKRAKVLVLTSATLSAPTVDGKPDFVEMKDALGIWDSDNSCAHLHAGFSPMKYGKAQFVFPAPDAHHPFLDVPDDDGNGNDDDDHDDGANQREINPEWVDYVARMVKAARAEKPGRILVLANSYRSTEKLAAAIRQHGIEVIEKTRLNRQDECIQHVLAADDAVFVSPSAWEGFDLGIRKAWAHVIMSQIPFGVVDGVRERAIIRHLKAKGKSDKEARAVAFVRSKQSAKRKARQGFGRGIRFHDDEVTFWIADPRFPLPRKFLVDTSGRIPIRTVRAHNDMMFVIPKRFRSGVAVNPVEKESRVFLVSGELVS